MESVEITTDSINCFRYEKGFLLCENVKVADISKLVRENGEQSASPVFVFSKNQIIRNIKSYTVPMKSSTLQYRLNYAMKANMNPSIMRIMKDHHCDVTTVSGLELQLALMLGFEPEHIVLNGNGKQRWEIELAVQHGCLVNIDSMFNLEQTIAVCRQMEKMARVLLRVNPDIDPVNIYRFLFLRLVFIHM